MDKRFLKFDNSKKGSALVFIIILFFILSIMAATISILFSNNLAQAKRQENNLKAHYLAMSGIDVTVANLMSTVEISPSGDEVKMYRKIIDGRVDKELEDSLNLDGTEINIKLKYNNSKKDFTITSKVETSDGVSKELSLNLIFSGNSYKKKWS